MGTSCTKSVWERPAQTLWIHFSFAFSFDHLVGGDEQARWHRETQRLRRLQVNYGLVLGWHLHRKIGRLGTAQYSVNIRCGQTKLVDAVRAVAHKSTGRDEETVRVHGR